MFNNNASNPTITDCIFKENTSASYGGGIANYNSSAPIITNCTFENNTANGGNGIINNNSSPIIENSIFINNTTTVDSGGGIYNYKNSIPTLIDCTFIGNIPEDIFDEE